MLTAVMRMTTRPLHGVRAAVHRVSHAMDTAASRQQPCYHADTCPIMDVARNRIHSTLTNVLSRNVPDWVTDLCVCSPPLLPWLPFGLCTWRCLLAPDL